MRRMYSVFERDQKGKQYLARDEVVEGSEWVLEGEGRPTRKWDGTSCAVINGVFYKRLHHKEKKGEAPADWIHWSGDPLQRSGHGWLKCSREDPQARLHFEAWDSIEVPSLADGTYELCGPKVQSNPDGFDKLVLIRHGEAGIDSNPRTFEEIREFLETADMEGIVWHHEGGRMAKIKKRDFGFSR